MQVKSNGPNSQVQKTPDSSKSDPACSSSGWCGEPWPWTKDEQDRIVKYPTGLPLDKDIRDSQSNLKDTEAKMGPFNINKDPSKYS